MSLIRDALKEAQKKRGETRASISPPPLPPSKKDKHKKRPFLVFAIFSVILFVFIGYFYVQSDKILKKRNKNIVKPLLSSQAIEAPAISKEVPKESSANSSLDSQEKTALPPPQEQNYSNTVESNVPPILPTPTSLTPYTSPAPPKKTSEKLIEPEISEPQEEKESKIEIIRSLLSSAKSSPFEKELKEIKEAENNEDWGRASLLWEKLCEKIEKKEYLLNAGVASKKAGNLQKAEQFLLKSLSFDPQYISALNNLGVLYLEKNDYLKAIDYLQRALSYSSSDPEILINTGIALFKTNNLKEARFYFEEALKLKAELFQPYYYLGIICLKEKDNKKALHYFSKLLQIAPENFPSDLRKWVEEKIRQIKPPSP